MRRRAPARLLTNSSISIPRANDFTIHWLRDNPIRYQRSLEAFTRRVPMSTQAMTTQEREVFLAESHTAVVSVANDGNRPPHSVPVWYHYEPAGNFTFFSGIQQRV